jgi:hypothetical protein
MTDSSPGKVPVGEVVRASWRFLFENWRGFVPAALIVAAFATIAPVLVLAATGPTVSGVYLGLFLTMLAGVFFAAAVLRKAARNEFLGPTGLAFGRDEVNLTGVLLCMLLLLLPPALLMVLVLTFAIAGRVANSPEAMEAIAADPEAFREALAGVMQSPTGTVIALLALVLMAVGFVVLARLVMANAATIGEQKIVFLQTWSWSKGNVGRVVGALLLTALPVVLLNLMVSSLLSGVPAQSMGVALLVGFVASVAGLMISIPVIALGANLYKGLRPPNFVAK